MTKKRHLKKKYKIILIILAFAITLFLWARFISTNGLYIREYKIVNNNIPSSFEGLKIVHFSDVHYGRTINITELKRLVNEINELKPDLIFFTGDLIDKDTKMTTEIKKTVAHTLNKLVASIGKYSISGNHDLEFKEYDEIIKNSGFININNSYDIIYSSTYETIYIAGLESEVRGTPDLDVIIKSLDIETEDSNNVIIPSYKIILLHTPDTIAKLEKYSFDLALAGHSHNGQIRLPFIGAIATPIGAKKYYEAYYKISDTDLYISGGLGTSNMNFRFFNRPSFNFYRLSTK